MSSHKRRNKDKPSSDKQSSKSNLDDHCNISNSYEKRSHEDGINHHERDSEYEAYSKNRKQQRSKERNYEKTKSRFRESDDEQYERCESGYSEISSHSKRNKESGYSEISSHNRRNKESGYSEISSHNRRNKESRYSEMSSHNRRNKDFNKVANYADGRDSQTKKYRSNGDNDDDYYRSKNKVRNTVSEGRSYNEKEKEKRYEKSDKNRHYKTKECVPDDGDSDYSGNKVRDKNLDDNSHSRKEKRYENYHHSSEDDPTSESNYRDSHSKKYLSDDDGDNYYSSSKAKAGNSKCSLYTEKYQKSDHFNDSYNRDKRRDQTDRRDNRDYSGRNGMDYRRRQEFSGERDSFFSKRDDSHDNRHTRTVAEVHRDSRSENSGDLKSDGAVDGETNKETNSSDAKAPKKMISGAYIPPAKLRLMQQQITDKGSIEYQKIAWEALKKSINGLTNKVNTSNIIDIVKELFKENIIRGRGVLTRALMQAQALSPTFTHVYAALVAVINTKFPEISELLLKRLILQFKRGFRRNDKQACLSSVRFIAHLLNQQVAHEVLVLEVLTLLLEHPTDHSVEVAIAMLKECGKRLEELSKRGCDAIFSRLRHVLHEGNLDKRTQYMIEVLFAVRKDKFKDYPSVLKELDLVEENDKFTHLVTLDEALTAEELLNVFKFDAEYEVNEEHYKDLVKEILGDSESEDSGDSEAEGSDSDEENDEDGESQKIIDMTESNLVALRRNIYLTIQSSLDFEECAHKLLKMELKPGEIMEMCYMILDCCAQQRTYEKFYGLLAQRFCQLNKVYMEPFMEIFRNSYETIHRLETNKLRNVAKFFAHLLYTDAIEWNVLSNIKLNENDTTSSSRIFIKILFQELSEYMGLPTLNKRVKDVTLQEAFDGLFPRDNPHNTRFAINFFTSIGLGGLTDELREHLKTAPKNPAMIQAINEKPPESSSEDSPSVDSSSSSSSSQSDSEDEEPPRKKKKSHGQKTSSISKKKGKSSRSQKHKNRKQSSAEVKHKKKRRN